MPDVQPPAKVLVSGATGYIAAWVVQNLLDRGYTVRGTARSVAKGDFLKKAFASYGDRFEIVIVEDIAQPAVNGTIGILKSIIKDESSKVKRVVITSSGAAILRDDPSTTVPTTFTEADWNNQCLEILKKYEDEGRRNDAPSLVKYRASKTLAERSAWEFVNSPENKSRINWDLVVLNPPFPAIHEITTPASLNTSARIFYNYVVDSVKANEAGNDFLVNTGTCWIDVRDLAEAHVLALEKTAAGGERIIVSAGLWKWQDFIDAANDVRPPPKLSTTLPVGVRGAGKTAKHVLFYSTAKADRILGLKYRTIAETTTDTLADYESRKW
ncbi:hypothetical protein V8E55_001190 [Tylopilus felleus]